MYTLYYSPGSASLAVRLALLELGVEHHLEKLDLAAGAQHAPGYRRLNPRGQVPTLVIDGKAYFESAALLLLLAERHPEARLAPPRQSARPAYYQWMAFLTNSMGAMYRLWFMPKDLGQDELPSAVREAIRQKIEEAGRSSTRTSALTAPTCSVPKCRSWTCSRSCTCAGRATCRSQRRHGPRCSASLRRCASGQAGKSCMRSRKLDGMS